MRQQQGAGQQRWSPARARCGQVCAALSGQPSASGGQPGVKGAASWQGSVGRPGGAGLLARGPRGGGGRHLLRRGGADHGLHGRRRSVAGCHSAWRLRAALSPASEGASLPEYASAPAASVRQRAPAALRAGMLALPSVSAPAGFGPTATLLVGLWGLLTAEALLIAEVGGGRCAAPPRCAGASLLRIPCVAALPAAAACMPGAVRGGSAPCCSSLLCPWHCPAFPFFCSRGLLGVVLLFQLLLLVLIVYLLPPGGRSTSAWAPPPCRPRTRWAAATFRPQRLPRSARVKLVQRQRQRRLRRGAL